MATVDFGLSVRERLSRPEYLTPRWSKLLRPVAEGLDRFVIGALPERLGDLERISSALPQPPRGVRVTAAERQEAACGVLAMALSLALAESGWTILADRERHGRAARGGVEIDPADLLERLRTNNLTADAWRDVWDGAGLARTDLGQFARRLR